MAENEAKPFDVQAEFANLTAAMKPEYRFLDEKLTDMEVVILSTSTIDKFLELVMVLKFAAEPSRNEFEEVFRGNGPLSTFSAKISVASALGAIHGDLKHDLKLLRKIRNEFAHSLMPPQLAGMRPCRSLKMRIDRPLNADSIERKQFVLSAAACVQMLAIAATVTMVESRLLAANRDQVRDISSGLVKSMLETSPEPSERSA